MSEIIASVSGVRGIYGQTLTPYNIIKFTSAFASYLKSYGKNSVLHVAVGRDGRIHGEKVSGIVINTLLMSGINVTDIGVVPTPTVQIATEDLKCSGGISVTASHNPQQWNGLKFLNSDGTFLDGNQIGSFLQIAIKGEFKFSGVQNIGKLHTDSSWIEKHVSKVLNLNIIDEKKIRKRKFKVVVDAVNSSGSVIVPMLLKKLGCSVIELFCDGSGIFPHTPEPLPDNLKLLSASVKKHKADFGISVDPDADRLVLITDTGEPFGEENTITAVSDFVLRNTPDGENKNLTVNLSTSRSVEDIAEKYNAKVFRSPVGEINVVNEMKKRKSVIGGEGSGGVIYPELHYGRDSLAGIVLMLNEFAEFKGKVSIYKNQMPQYFISKSKVENIKAPGKVISSFHKHFSKDNSVMKISTDDGIKIDFRDYWVHLRKSNTEPIIRIITEAATKEHAVKMNKRFVKMIMEMSG